MSKAKIEQIELTLGKHDESIQTAINSLNSIHATLQQIKWFAVGGVAVIIASQFGLLEILNLMKL